MLVNNSEEISLKVSQTGLKGSERGLKWSKGTKRTRGTKKMKAMKQKNEDFRTFCKSAGEGGKSPLILENEEEKLESSN